MGSVFNTVKLAAAAVFAVGVLGVGQVQAAAYTDTVDSTNGGAGTYFVPDPSLTYSSPYYRGYGSDWGYTHGAVAGTFSSAVLNISAFDVDASSGEVDLIYAYDNGVKTLLGALDGGNDIYSFTDFVLGANFYDDIAAGLQVFMHIDDADAGWVVTLAKSSLSIDGGRLPPPIPGASGVPEPATWAMLILGFGAIGASIRSRRRAALTA